MFIVLVLFRLNMWSEKRRPCQHMNSLTFTVNWLWHGYQLLSLRSKCMRVSIIALIDSFFFFNNFNHTYIQILSLFPVKSNSAHSIWHAVGLYVPIPDLYHSLSANLWSSSTLQCYVIMSTFLDIDLIQVKRQTAHQNIELDGGFIDLTGTVGNYCKRVFVWILLFSMDAYSDENGWPLLIIHELIIFIALWWLRAQVSLLIVQTMMATSKTSLIYFILCSSKYLIF